MGGSCNMLIILLLVWFTAKKAFVLIKRCIFALENDVKSRV